jgi:hydroxyacylglutathione hydrolase
MGLNIYPIPLGFTNSYIIHYVGAVMIEGGYPKTLKDFKAAIEKIPINPEDIKLMIITHGHWDHIGSAKEIKAFTGAKIALHREEKEWLEKGLKPLPPGVTLWGRIFKAGMAMSMPFIKIPPAKVDVVLGDEGLSLEEYGVPGKVLHTPGHSPGSVTVLLNTGDAFVGDLAMNKFPLRFRPGMPIFADDLIKLRQSWDMLLDAGAKTIYPAHGEPFSADIIRKALE